MRGWQSLPAGARTLGAAGVTLVGVGSGAASLLPSHVSWLLVAAGVVLFVIAIIWGAVSFFRVAAMEVGGRPSPHALALARIYSSYVTRQGLMAEVERMVELGEVAIGQGNHVPAKVLRERMVAAGSSVLTIVERTNGDTRRTAGYFIIYPLTKECCDRILDGSIVNATGIEITDLAPGGRPAAGLYIGGVCGSPEAYDQAAVVVYLRDRLSRMIGRGGDTEYLFAKPVTRSARRLMQEGGFDELRVNGSQIWKLGAFGVTDGATNQAGSAS